MRAQRGHRVAATVDRVPRRDELAGLGEREEQQAVDGRLRVRRTRRRAPGQSSRRRRARRTGARARRSRPLASARAQPPAVRVAGLDQAIEAGRAVRRARRAAPRTAPPGTTRRTRRSATALQREVEMTTRRAAADVEQPERRAVEDHHPARARPRAPARVTSRRAASSERAHAEEGDRQAAVRMGPGAPATACP